jgi:glycosyltransferase involved in cell wall biosynthesis
VTVRVCHLLSGDLWGGAAAATLHLTRVLAARADLDVCVLLLNPGVAAQRFAAAGLDVEVEPESGRSFLALARAVRARVAGVDLVHAHGYKEDLLAALSGRPWLATLHGRPEPLHGGAAARFAVYTGLDRVALRFGARRVIAVSRELERWLSRRIGARRVLHAWNGIADPIREPPPEAWARRPRRVGVLARLFPVKGVALAVEAVAACPGLELEIVGEGPEREALQRRAVALGAAERIRFVGFDPHPEARPRRWRLLLLTSLHEGNPISVLEALAWGTPVLSAPLPGVAEMLAGRGAGCSRIANARRWSAAILRRIDDVATGARASAQGRARFLEAFTADAAAKRMARVSVCAGKSRRTTRAVPPRGGSERGVDAARAVE